MSEVDAPQVSNGQESARARRQRRLARIPLHVAVILICIIWLLPTIGLLVSSFRPAQLVATTGWWTAFRDLGQFTLELYEGAIVGTGIGRAFINSIFITIPATIIPVMIAAFAAYAFSWMEFRGRNLLFVIVVGLIVVPLQMALIPILRIYSAIGWTGSFLGIWLAHTGFGLPFAIYLLRNFFGTLPREMLNPPTWTAPRALPPFSGW